MIAAVEEAVISTATGAIERTVASEETGTVAAARTLSVAKMLS